MSRDTCELCPELRHRRPLSPKAVSPQMPSGPFHAPAPCTQSTWMAPLLATSQTSVWLGMPNWLEEVSAAPAGAVPAQMGDYRRKK
jgi:hypothetical protein